MRVGLNYAHPSLCECIPHYPYNYRSLSGPAAAGALYAPYTELPRPCPPKLGRRRRYFSFFNTILYPNHSVGRRGKKNLTGYAEVCLVSDATARVRPKDNPSIERCINSTPYLMGTPFRF